MAYNGGTPVYVNIYDMYTMNNYISFIGVGVYHTGIEIYGTEYSYGGHPYPFSGIFEMVPRDVEELGETFRFKQSIEIGRTDFTHSEVEQLVTLLGRDYRGIDYHLMNKNCNHFAEKLCQVLCGAEIPPWINRLAYLTTFVPFIERMVPKEWISPIGIQHTVENHIHQEEEEERQHQQQHDGKNRTAQPQSQQQQQNERPTSSISRNLQILERNN